MLSAALIHVPFNLASINISNVLKRDTNKAFAKVVGDKVNRGAGYGLKIPCVYSLQALCMKKMVDLLVEKTGLIARL